jgi:Trypsin-co-occurring domain 2
VANGTEPEGWVELSDAIAALRRDLTEAWWDGRNQRVRFKVEPVELTVQVGVTRTGKGSAGVKWHILALGGERSREATTTQILRLRLAPVLYDDKGERLSRDEQLISDLDDVPVDLDDGVHHTERARP